MGANTHLTTAIVNATVVTTAETVIASIGPLAINQGLSAGGQGDLRNLQPATGPGPEGQLFQIYSFITVGTAATTATFRVRPNTIGTAAVATSVAFNTAAGGAIFSMMLNDPTLNYPVGVTYLLTVAFASATGNSTVNTVIFTSEDCNSFE